jgi:tetratricopeptide (TPR) repeat protein
VRLGQGAFLALRIVDLFARDREPVDEQVFHSQLVASERYCAELEAEGPEARHLSDICAMAADARRTGRFESLRAALAGYGTFLQDRGADAEAADVFRTAAWTAHQWEETRAAPFWVRAGNALARAGRWEDAGEAYRTAQRAGDRETRLLARAGLADVLRARQQVGESIARFEEVLRAARRARSVPAERAAALGLARALGLKGQPVEAAVHAWSAFATSESDTERAEAAGDLGSLLEVAGAPDAAARAYALAVPHSRGADRWRALIGLLRVSAARGDRIAFERWRRELESVPEEEAPPAPAAALEIAVEGARGLARFGQLVAARRALRAAALLERDAGSVGRAAALEHELDRLARAGVAPEPESRRDALAPVVAGLERLVAHDGAVASGGSRP